MADGQTVEQLLDAALVDARIGYLHEELTDNGLIYFTLASIPSRVMRPMSIMVAAECWRTFHGEEGLLQAEQKAAAEQRKAEQVARAEAYKLERKKRLTAQEKKRHETQVREIENRKKRVQAYYDKQMRNIEAASERENTRHEKRIAQIDEI